MGRYAFPNDRVVTLSRYKHTPEVVQGPTKKQETAHKNAMQRDLIKKYELINTLTDLGILEVRWHDNYVEFSKTISGVNYEKYVEWYREQEAKESE